MEAAAAAGRSVSLSQSPSRKQWRAVSEHSVRNAGTEVFYVGFFLSFHVCCLIVCICVKLI